jgi:hypothetical protein
MEVIIVRSYYKKIKRHVMLFQVCYLPYGPDFCLLFQAVLSTKCFKFFFSPNSCNFSVRSWIIKYWGPGNSLKITIDGYVDDDDSVLRTWLGPSINLLRKSNKEILKLFQVPEKLWANENLPVCSYCRNSQKGTNFPNDLRESSQLPYFPRSEFSVEYCPIIL